MDRKISLADVQHAVDAAYEQYKSVKEGTVDAMVSNDEAGNFGITVMLTDGTKISKGDTNVGSPMGRIALVPTHVLLLTQNTPEQLVRKAGYAYGKKAIKPQIMVSPHGVRAVSVVQPQGDADGKYDIMMDNIINLMGSAPVFDDKLYEAYRAAEAKEGTVNRIATAEYSLYDSAESSVDLYTRLSSLRATTDQLATMGATIAADGRNPINGNVAFDGKIAQNVVATMARGVHKGGRAWMMTVGLPAANSFGGAIVAVMPGFGAIAAYAPQLDENGVSVRAAKAIQYIAGQLGLNVYSSARVDVKAETMA